MPPEDKSKNNKKFDANKDKKFLCPDKEFFSWNYRIRNIDFMNDFDDESARSFITQVRAFSKELADSKDPNKDIFVYINSRGGIVTSLLAMIDAMSLVPNDFVTVCIGQCASCGAVFLSSGTKGKRFITENARVLIHQVSSGMWGKNSEIQADAKEADRMNKLLLSMLAKNCGKTVEELEQLTLGGDLILDAKQAVEFGIVDAILTKDMIAKLANGESIYIGDEEENNTPSPDEEQEQEGVHFNKKGKESFDTTSLNLEIKSFSEDNDNYYIKGLASTPDLDRVDDIVMPEALIDSVNRIGLPAFVHQHDLKSMPLGVCVSAELDANNGTEVFLKMPKDDYSDKIKSRVEIGAYKGLSIGFVSRDTERTKDGHRIIKSLDWYEVSLVTVPANPHAKILQVKGKTQENIECDIMNDIKTVRDVESLLVSVGCTKKEAGYIISVIKNCSKPQGDPSEEEQEEGKGEQSQNNNDDINALLQLKEILKGSNQ